MISIREVEFMYGDETVLKGINLSLKSGERVAMIGPNGSGKSTLALIIKGLLKPSAGSVEIDGIPPEKTPPGKLGILFQNPEDQIAATTVEREIAFGLENIGMPPPEMKERVEKVLNDFGLHNYRKHPPHLLSGGQLQKLALASVMAMQPDYLILDEPTSMLDPRSRGEFLQSLNKLPENTGVLFITQFPRETLDFERLLVVNEGKIFFDGNPQMFYTNESLTAKVAIEPPIKLQLKQIN